MREWIVDLLVSFNVFFIFVKTFFLGLFQQTTLFVLNKVTKARFRSLTVRN